MERTIRISMKDEEDLRVSEEKPQFAEINLKTHTKEMTGQNFASQMKAEIKRPNFGDEFIRIKHYSDDKD